MFQHMKPRLFCCTLPTMNAFLASLYAMSACVLLVVIPSGCAMSSRVDPHAAIVNCTLITTKGDITLELNQAMAPISVANFIAHARAGHYDNTTFHRVVPGFVIQGGGWTADLQERAKIDEAAGRKDVPIKNEWQNGLKNLRGTIAMARDAAPDTATREFYINLVDNAKLDTAREKTGNAGYAVFGRVIRGMDVVDAIAMVPTSERLDLAPADGGLKNIPVEPIIIRSVQFR